MRKTKLLKSIKAINKEPLNQILITKIKHFIIENNLRPGDRLPTEQELAESFGVSRLSVREATKTLGFLGIVDSAPQRGLTIASIDLKRLSEYLGFHFAINNYPKEDLLHARVVIETGSMIYIAKAMAADASLYKQFSDILDKADNINDLDLFIEYDIDFHRHLIIASGIEPLIPFNDLLNVFFAKFRHEIDIAHSDWAKGIQVHRKIVELLHHGNPDEAANNMRQHLFYYYGI